MPTKTKGADLCTYGMPISYDIMVKITQFFAFMCNASLGQKSLFLQLAHKKYPDLMIAAMTKVGKHIVVTRNLKDFENLPPPNQLANWIDIEPA